MAGEHNPVTGAGPEPHYAISTLVPDEGEGAMTVAYSPHGHGTAIAVEALTAESMCVISFRDDRAAGDYFRRWVSRPEVMEQFRRWVHAEPVLPGHSRACSAQSVCTCGGQCYTSAIGARVHGPGCKCETTEGG